MASPDHPVAITQLISPLLLRTSRHWSFCSCWIGRPITFPQKMSPPLFVSLIPVVSGTYSGFAICLPFHTSVLVTSTYLVNICFRTIMCSKRSSTLHCFWSMWKYMKWKIKTLHNPTPHQENKCRHLLGRLSVVPRGQERNTQMQPSA